MSAHVVIPLAEFSSSTMKAIGERGVRLGQYDTLAVPLPTTVALPHQVFVQLVSENRIFEQITKYLENFHKLEPSQRPDLIKKVRHIIKTQRLPEWFTQPILETYHTSFRRGFVRLLPGDAESFIDPSMYEHIQGDANLFESLLNFWVAWAERNIETNDKLLASSVTPPSIVMQEQFQALASGEAYTENPHSEIKSQVFIQAIKGCPDTVLMESQADQFAVDIRTWNVIFRNIVAQTRQVQRSSDDLETIPVPYSQQLSATLSDLECARLAQLVNQFKLHNLSHYKLSWELTDRGFFFTEFEPLTEPNPSHHGQIHSSKTITNLYISAGNPHRAQSLATGRHQGIGVLRSEYTYAQFGMHPAHVLKSRQREVLERQLANTLEMYRSAVNYKRVIFRAQNFNSQESLLLDFSSPYEPQEKNPFLGYRGGLKMITHTELLGLELKALKHALQHHGGPIGYMIPFVRSPQELSIITQQVEAAGLFSHPEFELWWQINTPENILNFPAYPTQRLSGISVNVTTLQALLHGIDPENPEVYDRYQLGTESIEHLMQHLVKQCQELKAVRTNPTALLLHLHLEDFSRELVTTAVKLGYDGIVVKPRALEIARVCVLEQEEALLLKKST